MDNDNTKDLLEGVINTGDRYVTQVGGSTGGGKTFGNAAGLGRHLDATGERAFLADLAIDNETDLSTLPYYTGFRMGDDGRLKGADVRENQDWFTTTFVDRSSLAAELNTGITGNAQYNQHLRDMIGGEFGPNPDNVGWLEYQFTKTGGIIGAVGNLFVDWGEASERAFYSSDADIREVMNEEDPEFNPQAGYEEFKKHHGMAVMNAERRGLISFADVKDTKNAKALELTLMKKLHTANLNERISFYDNNSWDGGWTSSGASLIFNYIGGDPDLPAEIAAGAALSLATGGVAAPVVLGAKGLKMIYKGQKMARRMDAIVDGTISAKQFVRKFKPLTIGENFIAGPASRKLNDLTGAARNGKLWKMNETAAGLAATGIEGSFYGAVASKFEYDRAKAYLMASNADAADEMELTAGDIAHAAAQGLLNGMAFYAGTRALGVGKSLGSQWGDAVLAKVPGVSNVRTMFRENVLGDYSEAPIAVAQIDTASGAPKLRVVETDGVATLRMENVKDGDSFVSRDEGLRIDEDGRIFATSRKGKKAILALITNGESLRRGTRRNAVRRAGFGKAISDVIEAEGMSARAVAMIDADRTSSIGFTRSVRGVVGSDDHMVSTTPEVARMQGFDLDEWNAALARRVEAGETLDADAVLRDLEITERRAESLIKTQLVVRGIEPTVSNMLKMATAAAKAVADARVKAFEEGTELTPRQLMDIRNRARAEAMGLDGTINELDMRLYDKGLPEPEVREGSQRLDEQGQVKLKERTQIREDLESGLYAAWSRDDWAVFGQFMKQHGAEHLGDMAELATQLVESRAAAQVQSVNGPSMAIDSARVEKAHANVRDAIKDLVKRGDLTKEDGAVLIQIIEQFGLDDLADEVLIGHLEDGELGRATQTMKDGRLKTRIDLSKALFGSSFSREERVSVIIHELAHLAAFRAEGIASDAGFSLRTTFKLAPDDARRVLTELSDQYFTDMEPARREALIDYWMENPDEFIAQFTAFTMMSRADTRPGWAALSELEPNLFKRIIAYISSFIRASGASMRKLRDMDKSDNIYRYLEKDAERLLSLGAGMSKLMRGFDVDKKAAASPRKMLKRIAKMKNGPDRRDALLEARAALMASGVHALRGQQDELVRLHNELEKAIKDALAAGDKKAAFRHESERVILFQQIVYNRSRLTGDRQGSMMMVETDPHRIARNHEAMQFTDKSELGRQATKFVPTGNDRFDSIAHASPLKMHERELVTLGDSRGNNVMNNGGMLGLSSLFQTGLTATVIGDSPTLNMAHTGGALQSTVRRSGSGARRHLMSMIQPTADSNVARDLGDVVDLTAASERGMAPAHMHITDLDKIVNGFTPDQLGPRWTTDRANTVLSALQKAVGLTSHLEGDARRAAIRERLEGMTDMTPAGLDKSVDDAMAIAKSFDHVRDQSQRDAVDLGIISEDEMGRSYPTSLDESVALDRQPFVDRIVKREQERLFNEGDVRYDEAAPEVLERLGMVVREYDDTGTGAEVAYSIPSIVEIDGRRYLNPLYLTHARQSVIADGADIGMTREKLDQLTPDQRNEFLYTGRYVDEDGNVIVNPRFNEVIKVPRERGQERIYPSDDVRTAQEGADFVAASRRSARETVGREVDQTPLGTVSSIADILGMNGGHQATGRFDFLGNREGVEFMEPDQFRVLFRRAATEGSEGPASAAWIETHPGNPNPLELEAQLYIKASLGEKHSRGLGSRQVQFEGGARAKPATMMRAQARYSLQERNELIDPDGEFYVYDTDELAMNQSRNVGVKLSVQREFRKFTRLNDMDPYEYNQIITREAETVSESDISSSKGAEDRRAQTRADAEAVELMLDSIYQRGVSDKASTFIGSKNLVKGLNYLQRRSGSITWSLMSLVEEGMKNVFGQLDGDDLDHWEPLFRVGNTIKMLFSTKALKSEMADAPAYMDLIREDQQRMLGEVGVRRDSRRFHHGIRGFMGRFFRGYTEEGTWSSFGAVSQRLAKTAFGDDITRAGSDLLTRITAAHIAVGMRSDIRKMERMVLSNGRVGKVAQNLDLIREDLTPDFMERIRKGQLTKADKGVLRKAGFPAGSYQVLLDLHDARLLAPGAMARLGEVFAEVHKDKDQSAMMVFSDVSRAALDLSREHYDAAIAFQRWMRLRSQRAITLDTAATGFARGEASFLERVGRMLMGFTRNNAGTSLSQARRGTTAQRHVLQGASSFGALATGMLIDVLYGNDPVEKLKEDPLGTLMDYALFNPRYGIASAFLQMMNDFGRFAVSNTGFANQYYGGLKPRRFYPTDMIPNAGNRAIKRTASDAGKFIGGLASGSTDWADYAKLMHPSLSFMNEVTGDAFWSETRPKRSSKRGVNLDPLVTKTSTEAPVAKPTADLDDFVTEPAAEPVSTPAPEVDVRTEPTNKERGGVDALTKTSGSYDAAPDSLL